MKYYIGKPAIFHRDNNIVIVWEKDTLQISQSNIYYQEFTEEGVPVNEIVKVNDINASEANSVAADIDNEGNIIIVWEGWPDLYGQRYSSDMSRIGENFKINTSESDGNAFPCVRLRNGKIYTAWDRLNHGKTSVWMNILDFNNPTNIVTKTEEYPLQYYLSQNHPNPFNPTTTIEYSLPSYEHVKIEVYDLLGREIITLVDEDKLAGSYKVEFDGSGLTSGIYFYKLQAGRYTEAKKLLLIK